MGTLDHHYYTPLKGIRTSVRIALIPRGEKMKDDDIDLWHLASLFMSKVFTECKRQGVTPRTASGEVNLTELIEEAEKELGIYVSVDDLLMMNKFPRQMMTDEITRRRSFAFSALIRMTSGMPRDGR
jgi:hypothetical protein